MQKRRYFSLLFLIASLTPNAVAQTRLSYSDTTAPIIDWPTELAWVGPDNYMVFSAYSIPADYAISNLPSGAADFIKNNEGNGSSLGRAFMSYEDTSHYATIDYGHLLFKGQLSDEGWNWRISPQESERVFEYDVYNASKAIEDQVPNFRNWTSGQKAAILDFVFQFDGGAFWNQDGSQTRIGRALKQGDWASVVKELPFWINSGGKPYDSILQRRNSEISLIQTGHL